MNLKTGNGKISRIAIDMDAQISVPRHKLIGIHRKRWMPIAQLKIGLGGTGARWSMLRAFSLAFDKSLMFHSFYM